MREAAAQRHRGLGRHHGGGVIYQATYTHFLQEARALSKLAHPNTLRIYDFGFLRWTTGEGDVAARPSRSASSSTAATSRRTCARAARCSPGVLAILDRIAGAVGEAHGAGIIHRDIKPSNILFSRVGDVLMPKLADFGIARGVHRAAGATGSAVEPEDTLKSSSRPSRSSRRAGPRPSS